MNIFKKSCHVLKGMYYASVNSSCDHPPPGQCGGICTRTCPHSRTFAAACSPGGRAFVNIGLLPPGICRSQRKDRGHKFPLLYAKMDNY
jgi:hypothetical protein